MIRIWGLLLMLATAFTLPVSGHEDPEIAGYITVDGGRIWYRMNGARHLGKKPAILVAHGGPGGTHRGNMPYVALSDTYPVILYDQLGTGNSDRTGDKKNWTTDRFVDEIDHIRKALGLGDVIFAGHSWGGTLAAEYAVRRPDGLIGTIMSSPLLSTPQWNEDNAVWIDQLPPDAQATIRAHWDDTDLTDPEFADAVGVFYSRHMCRTGRCTDKGYRAKGPAANEDMYLYMWGPTDFRGIGTLKNYDITPKLDQVLSPTLIICGEFDEAAPKSCHRYAEMINDARTVIIPDAGHATMAADEALYMQTVRTFVDQLTMDK